MVAALALTRALTLSTCCYLVGSERFVRFWHHEWGLVKALLWILMRCGYCIVVGSSVRGEALVSVRSQDEEAATGEVLREAC